MNTSGGIVHFSTANSGNGNDNNVLFRNKITHAVLVPASTARVVNAIYSEGTASRENSGIGLIENEVFNVLNPSVSSNAIHVAANSTAFTISGNSVYETSVIVPTGAFSYQGIRLNNPSGIGFTITGNYVGGRGPLTQGLPMTFGTVATSNNFTFHPLYLNVGTGSASSVQANVLSNIHVTSSSITPFAAIRVDAGAVNVGTLVGNTIGSSTGFGSIVLKSTALTTTESYGIWVNGVGAVVVSNNAIGSIYTTHNNAANGHSIYGVFKSLVAGDLIISKNIVGSLTTEGSIRAVSPSSSQAQYVVGLFINNLGNTELSDNTIVNLLDSTTVSGAERSVGGIYINGSTSTTNLIQRNFIYKLKHASKLGSVDNYIAGIYLGQGSMNVLNNIIWLGETINHNSAIYGIIDQCSGTFTSNILHNTIYLFGSVSNETRNSIAYYKTVVNVGATTTIKNNIFYNKRTGGWGGQHYAIWLPSKVGINIDANDYIGNATEALYYMAVGSPSGTISTLANWRTSTSGDANSITNIPFVTTNPQDASSFRPNLDLYGVNVNPPLLVSQDYGLNPRNTSQPTIGAWERLNKWKGLVSIDFANALNWTFNMVPSLYDNVVFDDAPLRPCLLDQDRYIKNIVNNQSVHRLDVNSKKLTIQGDLLFTNGAQIDASATGSIVDFNRTTSLQTIPSGAFYQDKVYNLSISNPYNVVLNGSLILLNQVSINAGRLNATSTGATFIYGGTSPQALSSNVFLNEKTYNLGIQNPAGVTLNTTFAVDNNLTISSGSVLYVNEDKGLTVSGTLSNNAGTSGLILKSSALGTASLVHNTSNVPATVQRYIGGPSLAWHFLSSPVSNQTIHSTSWTPAGSYGDNTGYDLYAWYEATNCWVYNLNTDSATTWQVANPGSYFIPGKGYLYAVEALNPTKSFVGNLNNGVIGQTITNSLSALSDLRGFNFIGNPYPSSIDWRNNAGYSRNMLVTNGGGHWIWVWSTLNNNYGVYNSADVDAIGTNNVTAFIAPMQSFFVEAENSGSFTFNNDARSHLEASSWLRSMKSERSYASASIKNLRLAVKGQEGGDEVKLGFGFEENGAGARKMFSPVREAPSLYLNVNGESYSTRRLTDTHSNKYVSLNFKAAVAGVYTFNANFDVAEFESVFLQDRKTGTITNLNETSNYSFVASAKDDPNRFVLHFGEVVSLVESIKPNVWVESGQVHVYLENMVGDYKVRVYNVQGQQLYAENLSGGEKINWTLFAQGQYLVEVSSGSKSHSVKVMR